MNIESLQSIITALPNACKVSFGFETLQSKMSYSHKGDTKYPAASMAKLFILGAAISDVLNQNLSYEQLCIIEKSRFVGGSGILKYTNSKVQLKFKELLYLMIAYSDNIATNAIIELVGFERIKNFISSIGISSTNISVPMMPDRKIYGDNANLTTVNDIIRFYEIITTNSQKKAYSFSSECLNILNNATAVFSTRLRFLFSPLNIKIFSKVFANNFKITKRYLTVVMDNKINQRLISQLDKSIILANKSATGITVFHDSCIVKDKKDTFIIVCLVSCEDANYADQESNAFKTTKTMMSILGKEITKVHI